MLFLSFVFPSSHASVKPHSPHSSACRYFPVQSECSPAPGRQSTERSRHRAASLRSPQANWRHRECVTASQTEHKVTSQNYVHQKWVYLVVEALYLVFGAIRQVLPWAIDGGKKQLGISQQGVSPLQISPQLLLHVEVSVPHLWDGRAWINPSLREINLRRD